MTKGTVGNGTFDISNEQLQNAESLCIQNLRMPEEALKSKMGDLFELTKAASAAKFDCKAMYAAFPIEQVDGSEIRLQDGQTITSSGLAERCQNACKLVVFAIAAHGFEELRDNAQDSMLEPMFYTSWGVGYSTSSQMWLEDLIRERAHELGLYTGRSWCPGENDLDMTLQGCIAELLALTDIGIEMKGLSMSPFMSVAGFIIVSDDPDIELEKTAFMV